MRRDDREDALAAIQAADADWSNLDDSLQFGEVRWRPDLRHQDGTLLHTFFEDLDEPWRKRMAAAREAGNQTAVACPLEALSLDVLGFLQEIDATIVLLGYDSNDVLLVQQYESAAHLVALAELSLGHVGLRELGEQRLRDALEADSNYDKGRYFEQVLLLLFSQVSFFMVHSSRYKNDTEEIDLVLGNRGLSPIKDTIGGPIVLVSAKNLANPVGAPEVRALWGNMAKRRGRCTLGVLCASRKLASTAATERASSTTDPTLAVALVDGARLRQLLQSATLDADMEAVVREAVME
jgi:hypothetical protein